MPILLDILLFLAGLVVIIKGADWLTDGASKMASHFGVSSIVIGLTVVAFGSSAPEFVVSVVSAVHGNCDMALGNIVGSNIFNILGIMGITAVIYPIKVERSNVRYDVPFVILSSVVIAITALDPILNSSGEGVISRNEGLLMLCMFAIFMSYTFSITNTSSVPTKEEGASYSLLKSSLLFIAGLAGLIFGADWIVDGATGMARAIGISDAVIALTVVSIGTSTPELAASIMAAKKGDTGLALGNLVGSAVFNVFFVLGTCSTILPLGIGGVSHIDIAFLLFGSVLFYMLCSFGKEKLTLTRSEGAFMVLCITAYYSWLIYNA